MIGEAPCSDGASTRFATTAPRRGQVCHYGRTVITFLSFIGIPDLKYMYVRCPLFVFYRESLLKYTMENSARAGNRRLWLLSALRAHENDLTVA